MTITSIGATLMFLPSNSCLVHSESRLSLKLKCDDCRSVSASHGYLDNRRLNSGTFPDIIGSLDKQFPRKIEDKLDHSS